MSRTAKATLAASVLATSAIVFGVHYMQLKEAENMYMGVIKDEARTKAKRQMKLEDAANSSSPSPTLAPVTTPVPVPNKTLFERKVEYDRNLALQEELGREQGLRASEEERQRLERERRSGGRI